MSSTLRATLPALACAALACWPRPATADDVPPFGPPVGVKADVVRSFALKTTGGLALAATGAKGDGKTGLIGLCKPTTWANFGVEVGTSFGVEKTGIAVITKGKIATGATGTFPLDKVYVDHLALKGQELVSDSFAGPGTLVITVHDGTPGHRRLVGTITGKKLKGKAGEKPATVDVEASFDMDFSCGVK